MYYNKNMEIEKNYDNKEDIIEEIRIGDIIRQRREELNITQDELCDGLCDRRTISRIENMIR